MNRSSILSIATFCAALAAAGPCCAQADKKPSPLYARLGFGYSFVHAGQTEINGAGINGAATANGNSFSDERKRASFGSGLSADLAGGYMITKHIGIELGVHAILSPEKYTYKSYDPSYPSFTRTIVSESKADLPVYIIPAVLLTTGDKLKFYGRAGLVVPVSDKMTVTETFTGTVQGMTTDVFTKKIENRFGLGLQGAAGLAYVLNDHLSVWGEASAISRNAYIKRSEITGYTQDGLDALPSYTTTQKVTEYDFESASEHPIPATEPNKQPTFSIPYSSIGLSVGVKYGF